MGNTKKLLGNKNVVTLLGIVLVVVVLYLFYIWRVRSAVDFVTIPIANKNIDPMKEIDANMVARIDVPKAALRGNVIYTESQVIGKFSGVNSYIPNGSFFYYSSETSAGNIVSKDDLPTAFLYEFDLDKDVVAYNYSVDTQSTYSNSVEPGKYIDVYLRVRTGKTQDEYQFGKLVSNVKVLAVKDGSGRNVFTQTNEVRTPASIVFGVDSEINYYLRTAENLIDNVEIIIVPTTVDAEIGEGLVPDATLSAEELKTYLDDYVEYLPSDEAEETQEPTNITE